MDLPWKPAELTQRNGRGIRSGNENNFINIVYAIAQDTVETGLLERLKAKQHFISEIMTMDLNNMGDEISDGEDRYNSLMELSTNNPLLRDSVMLKDEVRKLEIQAKTHRENGVRVMDRMRSLPDDIAYNQGKANKLSMDVAARPAAETLRGDNFQIKILGKDFAIKKDANGKVIPGTESARKDAGALIKDTLKKLSMSREDSLELGTYGGARISLSALSMSSGSYYRSYYFKSVGRNGLGHEVHSEPLSLDTDEVGLCMKIHNTVYDRTDHTLNVFKNRLQECEKELEVCKSFSGDFPKEQELQEKRGRLADVLKQLGGDVGKKFNGPEYEFPWQDLRSMTPEEIHVVEQNFYTRFEYFKEHGHFEDTIVDRAEKEINRVVAENIVVLDNETVDREDVDEFENDELAVTGDKPLTDMEMSVLVELDGNGTSTVLRHVSVDRQIALLGSLAERGYLAFSTEKDGAELTLKGREAVYNRLSVVEYDRAVVTDAVVSLVCNEVGLHRHVVKPIMCDCAEEYRKYTDFQQKFMLVGHSGAVGDIRSEHRDFTLSGYTVEAERIDALYEEVRGYAQELVGKYNTAVAKKFEAACDALDEYVSVECKNYQMVRNWSDRLDYDMGTMRGLLYERFVNSSDAVRSAGQVIQAVRGVYNVNLSDGCKLAMSKAIEAGVPAVRVYDGVVNHLERSPLYDWNVNCDGEYAMEYRRMSGGMRFADKDNINMVNRGSNTNEANIQLGSLGINDYGVKILGQDKGNQVYGVYRCDSEDKITGVCKLAVPEVILKQRVESYVLNRELEFGLKELAQNYSKDVSKPEAVVKSGGMSYGD